MRFLILTQYYPPEIGAPQVRLPAVARELTKAGHTVEVVTAMPNYPQGRIREAYRGRFYDSDSIDGIRVHRVWMYAATGAGLKRLASYLSFCLTCLAGLAKAERPDILFVESPPLLLAVPGFLAARIWGACSIMNIADLWPDSGEELGLIEEGWMLSLARALERWSYRVFDYLTAVTDGIRTELQHRHGVSRGKILFLPNGVDTNLFRPGIARQEWDSSLQLGGRKVILYAGTIGYSQGLEVAVQAAHRLRDRSDIAFVFVGGGSERTRLRQMAEELSLSNVHFLDPVPLDEVASMYRRSFAALVALKAVPIFDGARPSKILAALASGVPIVYSGAGEGAKLLDRAEAGVAVPPGDPERLSDAVRALADSPECARKQGESGRRYAEKHFGWHTLVREWLNQMQLR